MDISIIIPTLNRSFSLEKTVASIVKSDKAANSFEILIIDNGSTDTTKKVSEIAIKANSDHLIRYFYEPYPGLLSARHLGAKEAKADLLVFIDDDITSDKGWLSAIVDTFNRFPDIHIVGGKSLPIYEKEPPEWLSYFWKQEPDGGKWCGALSLLDFGDVEKEINPTFVWGLNYAIRKTTLYDLGGFNPDSLPTIIQYFLGDGETGLSIKAINKGFKAMYQPKSLVYHEVTASRMTIEYFDKRYFFQGICDSYTQIRANGGLLLKNPKKSILKTIKKPIREIYKMIVQLIFYKRLFKPDINIEKELLFLRFKSMENAGFQFHQRAAQASPTILNWVCQENYLNYELPNIDIQIN